MGPQDQLEFVPGRRHADSALDIGDMKAVEIIPSKTDKLAPYKTSSSRTYRIISRPFGSNTAYPPRHDCCSMNALKPPPQCDRCRRPLTPQELSNYRRMMTSRAVSHGRGIRSSGLREAKMNVLQKLSKDAHSLFSQSNVVLENIEKLKQNINSHAMMNEMLLDVATQTREIIFKKNKVNQTPYHSRVRKGGDTLVCETAVGGDDDVYQLENAFTQTDYEKREKKKEKTEPENKIIFPLMQRYAANTCEMLTLSCLKPTTTKETLSEFVKHKMPIESLLADRYRRVVCRQDIVQEPSFFETSERLISIIEEPSDITQIETGGAGEEYLSDDEDAKKYICFAEEITSDVLRKKCFSDESIFQVFRDHLKANSGSLDEKKMLEQIDYLTMALKIRTTSNCASQTVIEANEEPTQESSSSNPLQQDEEFMSVYTYNAKISNDQCNSEDDIGLSDFTDIAQKI